MGINFHNFSITFKLLSCAIFSMLMIENISCTSQQFEIRYIRQPDEIYFELYSPRKATITSIVLTDETEKSRGNDDYGVWNVDFVKVPRDARPTIYQTEKWKYGDSRGGKVYFGPRLLTKGHRYHLHIHTEAQDQTTHYYFDYK